MVDAGWYSHAAGVNNDLLNVGERCGLARAAGLLCGRSDTGRVRSRSVNSIEYNTFASTSTTRPDTATGSVVQAEIFGLAGQFVERILSGGVLAVAVREHIHEPQPAMCSHHPERQRVVRPVGPAVDASTGATGSRCEVVAVMGGEHLTARQSRDLDLPYPTNLSSHS